MKVLKLVPLSIFSKISSFGDVKLHTVSLGGHDKFVQSNTTSEVRFEHTLLTERVPNGAQVQFPDGQENGGSGVESVFAENMPLYIADTMLRGRRVTTKGD